MSCLRTTHQHIGIIATIDECDNGKLKCNVEVDHEPFINDQLRYQWYDGEKCLHGEENQELAQNPVDFESLQLYRCKVEYKAQNWTEKVETTSKTLKQRKWN